MTFNYGYGTFFEFGNNKKIVDKFDNLLNMGTGVLYAGCFSCYFSYYKPEGFTWAQPIVPYEINEIIDGINKQYQNIKFIILKEKVVNLKRIVDNFGMNSVYHISKDEEEIKKKIALFTFELNKDYTSTSKKYLGYLLHHMTRMLSYTENTFIEMGDKINLENPLESIVFINNRSSNKYRALSERDITVQNLLNLDNISACNQAADAVSKDKDLIKKYLTKNLQTHKQTNLLVAIELLIDESGLKRKFEEEEAELERFRQEIFGGKKHCIYDGILYELDIKDKDAIYLRRNRSYMYSFSIDKIRKETILVSEDEVNTKTIEKGTKVRLRPIADKFYRLTTTKNVQELVKDTFITFNSNSYYICTKSINKDLIGKKFIISDAFVEEIK